MSPAGTAIGAAKALKARERERMVMRVLLNIMNDISKGLVSRESNMLQFNVYGGRLEGVSAAQRWIG